MEAFAKVFELTGPETSCISSATFTSSLPARRASRLGPMVALRDE